MKKLHFGFKFGKPSKKILKIGWGGTGKYVGGSIVRIGFGRNVLNKNVADKHFFLPGTFVPNSIADDIINAEI